MMPNIVFVEEQMKKIKAGVIGVGYLGRFHAQKYAALENVELVGVVDVNPEQCEAVAKECNCMAFADYKDMLDKVDVVSIVVPTSNHYEVAKDCIEAGCDLLLEKPMTVTLEEADDLITCAKEKDLVFQVGHLERFNPAVLAMEPYLTTPAFIESHRIATFKNRATDVDVVLDLMIHDIDIILNIVKSPLKTIHTVGAPVATHTTDIANTRLIFENGATANVTVSRISFNNSRKMRIFQPGSYINVDFAAKTAMIVELVGEAPEGGGMPQTKISNEQFGDSDALKSEIISFISNVETRTRPVVSGEEGRDALALALEVMTQIKEGQKGELYKMLGKVVQPV